MVAWIYCAFVTPSPRLWCSWAFFNRSLPETLQFLNISIVSRLKATSPTLLFHLAHIRSVPHPRNRPYFATYKPLHTCRGVQRPLTLLLNKPCWPWRHSFTLIISSSCSSVAFLSKGFGGALQKIANQGCYFNARLATTKLSRDFAVLYPCTNRLKNSSSTLNVMNSI